MILASAPTAKGSQILLGQLEPLWVPQSSVSQSVDDIFPSHRLLAANGIPA
jgi:hypothetical protein